MQLLERSTLRIYGIVLLALFALTVAVTVTVTAAVTPRHPGHHGCSYAKRAHVQKNPRLVADQHYRAKRFDAAAVTLQTAAVSGMFDRELASELLVVASFYDQLGRSYALAFDPTTPLQEALTALHWAAELDAMLGGAHATELERAPVNP